MMVDCVILELIILLTASDFSSMNSTRTSLTSQLEPDPRPHCRDNCCRPQASSYGTGDRSFTGDRSLFFCTSTFQLPEQLCSARKLPNVSAVSHVDEYAQVVQCFPTQTIPPRNVVYIGNEVCCPYTLHANSLSCYISFFLYSIHPLALFQ